MEVNNLMTRLKFRPSLIYYVEISKKYHTPTHEITNFPSDVRTCCCFEVQRVGEKRGAAESQDLELAIHRRHRIEAVKWIVEQLLQIRKRIWHSFEITVLPLSAALHRPALLVLHFLLQCYKAGPGSHPGGLPALLSATNNKKSDAWQK